VKSEMMDVAIDGLVFYVILGVLVGVVWSICLIYYPGSFIYLPCPSLKRRGFAL
jgi:hypothetical protein